MDNTRSEASDDLNLHQFKAGTLLVSEGNESRKMFILNKGKVRVHKSYLGQRITLAILGEGEVFGELSFFDAEPRSASVEALTDVTVSIYDGNQASKDIEGLPIWILPILKTTFRRFREADQKLTVLQSMNEFQKKSFKADNVSQTIYTELLRFIKIFRLLYQEMKSAQGSRVSASELYREMDEMLGTRVIGLRVFWKLLKEHDFIDHEQEESSGIVVVNTSALESWHEYLLAEVASERFLLLGHVSIALLRRLVGVAKNAGKVDANRGLQMVSFDDIKIKNVPLFEEGVAELQGKGIVSSKNDQFTFQEQDVYRLYLFQTLLKAFDHSTMSIE